MAKYFAQELYSGLVGKLKNYEMLHSSDKQTSIEILHPELNNTMIVLKQKREESDTLYISC